MKPLLLLWCAAMLILCGCSNSTPSERAVRKMYEDQVITESQGSIKLVSFEKVNGQSAELAGVKAYIFQYKATIEFLEDGSWDGESFAWQGHFLFARGNSPCIGCLKYQKGAQVEIHRHLEFQQTEKGWQVDGHLLGQDEDPTALRFALQRQQGLTGNTQAEMKLGNVYKTGDGVPKDLAEAARWFQMAGAKGDVEGAREAALINMNNAAAQNRALRSEAKRLQGDANSQMCQMNLEVIALQAQIWAKNHGGKFPDYLIYLSNTIVSPMFFHCPADTAKNFPAGTTYANFDPSLISYEMVSPGIVENSQNGTTVYLKCPIHGFCVLVNGKVVAGK